MPSEPSEPSRRSWVEQVMGMPVSILARGAGADEPGPARAVALVYDELRRVDAMFSPYRDDSVVSRLGRGELRLVDCTDEVRDVAQRCGRAQVWTGGLFDASRPDGSWDPSGLVKGWAVERASRHLSEAGLEAGDVDWCLNAGGDVLVLARTGEPFIIGIQDPTDPLRVAAAVPCAGGAVATSGTAARGAHLYDPRTGEPVATRWLSVTVTGPSLETADVLATAAFVADDAWATTVAGVDGYEALAIAGDGTLARTARWPTAGSPT